MCNVISLSRFTLRLSEEYANKTGGCDTVAFCDSALEGHATRGRIHDARLRPFNAHLDGHHLWLRSISSPPNLGS